MSVIGGVGDGDAVKLIPHNDTCDALADLPVTEVCPLAMALAAPTTAAPPAAAAPPGPVDL